MYQYNPNQTTHHATAPYTVLHEEVEKSCTAKHLSNKTQQLYKLYKAEKSCTAKLSWSKTKLSSTAKLKQNWVDEKKEKKKKKTKQRRAALQNSVDQKQN